MSFRKQLKTTRARMAECHDEIEALGKLAEDENRDLTDEEGKMISDKAAEFEGLEKTCSHLQNAIATTERIAAARAAETQMIASGSPSVGSELMESPQMQALNIRLRHTKSKVFENTFDCYAMGQWLQGACGNPKAKQWAIDHGFTYQNAMGGDVPTAGQEVVPTPLAATIIRLVEEYGVYRRNARLAVMTSATLDVPRRTDGLTVYYPANQGDPFTPSDITFDQVALLAKKYAQLSLMSTELSEDSVISMTDLITTEQAWNFALAEDTNSFLGDGTPTYGGITGIANALQAGSLLAGGAGLWSGVSLNHLEQLAGLPPAYAGFRGKWYMSRYAYFTVVLSLLNAAGGTDMRQIEQGGQMMLMGYPVEFTQVLPGKAGANGDLAIVFGDLNLGAYIGSRRDVTIRVLNELYAATDQIGIIGSMRADSVIHDVGDATNAGAIVGLTLAT